MPQGEEPVSSGLVQANQDGPDCPGAAEPAAQRARGVRLRHRRLGAPQHGLHGAAGHVGRGDTLPHLQRLHRRRGEEVTYVRSAG